MADKNQPCTTFRTTYAITNRENLSGWQWPLVLFNNNTFMTNNTFYMTTQQHEGDSLLKDPRFWVIVFALALFFFRVAFAHEPGVVIIP